MSVKNRLSMIQNIRLKFNSSDIVKRDSYQEYPWEESL